MRRIPRIWKVGAVGAPTLTSLTACLVGGYGGDAGVGYVGGVYEPGGYERGGWPPGYQVGLRAAMSAGRAGERHPRFRMTQATAVAMTIVSAQRGTDPAF
jgi:hypothetical protein